MEEPKPGFTTDDLLAQISAQLILTDEGMSTKELCESMGMATTNTNMGKVSRQIRNLVALGRAEYAGKKHSVTLTGADFSVAAWKLVVEDVTPI